MLLFDGGTHTVNGDVWMAEHSTLRVTSGTTLVFGQTFPNQFRIYMLGNSSFIMEDGAIIVTGIGNRNIISSVQCGTTSMSMTNVDVSVGATGCLSPLLESRYPCLS